MTIVNVNKKVFSIGRSTRLRGDRMVECGELPSRR